MTTPTPRFCYHGNAIDCCDACDREEMIGKLRSDLAAAKSELAELKAHAAVEGSSDEVVRELQRVVLPSLRDYGQGYSAAVAERAAAHIIALRAELERERMRLCACGVAAMANTPESAANARQTHPDYRSASLSDVEQAVDREMALRAELASVKANCKIVYWPKDGSYPIEHTMAANKDCYEMILAQMERDRAANPKE